MYEEVTTKSALHKLKKKRLPYDWDLNIYRGCIHKCQYCYALYSHQYLESKEGFFDKIFVKTNIIENLERELASPKWQGDVINMGGVTDSYQAIEEKYGLMRKVLKVMIKYKNPIIISTKSDLILRDFDLLVELAKHAYVNIAATVTVMDEDLRKKIEPHAIPALRRIEMLKKFRDTKVNTGLHMMPIMPFITDTEKNIDEVFAGAQDSGVDYVLTGTLNLVGKTKEHFLSFVRNAFPEYYDEYLRLYKNWIVKKEYNKGLYEKIYKYKRKYGIPSNFKKPIKNKKNSPEQGKLFVF